MYVVDETPITDLDELIDDDMVEHPCDEFCKYENSFEITIERRRYDGVYRDYRREGLLRGHYRRR